MLFLHPDIRFSTGFKRALVASCFSTALTKSRSILWYTVPFICTVALCAVSQQHYIYYTALPMLTHCIAEDLVYIPISHTQ